MIPEKINRVHLTANESSPSTSSNLKDSLSLYEQGNIVGEFVYDSRSSALSLIHELKILTTIKFTQLEIAEQLGEEPNHQPSASTPKNITRSGLVGFGQIKTILRQHLDQSRLAQMPCSVILMMPLIDDATEGHHNIVLGELAQVIGNEKGVQDQLLCGCVDQSGPEYDSFTGSKNQCLPPCICLITPSTGLIKARLLVNDIKKHVTGSDWLLGDITLCAAVGVKTTTEINEDELLSNVTDLLKKSMQHGGKIFSYSDTSLNNQVTVEERTQLFMISQKAVS